MMQLPGLPPFCFAAALSYVGQGPVSDPANISNIAVI